MAIKQLKKKKTIEIDLTGEQGNAFYLLGFARQNAKNIGYTQTETESLIMRMMSSDYENLIIEFDKVFGKYVTLYR